MARSLSSCFVAILLVHGAAANDVILNPGADAEPYPAVAMTRDGKKIVTLGSNECLRVWSADTGKQLSELWLPEESRGKTGIHFVNNFWLSPDGQLVAIPCRVLEKPVARLAIVPITGPDVGRYRLVGGCAEFIEHAAFSPEGHLIATTMSSKPPIQIWDVVTGKKICEANHDSDLKVTGLAFSPDGKKLLATLPKLTAGEKRGPRLASWDAETGKLLSDVPLIDNGYPRPSWSPDGKTVMLDRGMLRLLATDGTQKQVVGELNDHPDAASFDTHGRLLAAWKQGDLLVVRDEITGKEIVRLADSGRGLAFSVERRRLLTRDACILTVHDIETGKQLSRFNASFPRVNALGWEGNRVLTWGAGSPPISGKEGQVSRAIDLATLEMVRFDLKTVTRRRSEWDGVKLTDDETGATVTTNGKSRKLDHKVEFEFDEIVATTLVGPDHAVLVTRSGAAGFDTRTGRRLCDYPGQIKEMAPSPDGKLLAASNLYDPLIRIFRPDKGEPVLTLYVGGDDWIAWTPHGEWASSAGGAKWAGHRSDANPGVLPTFVPFSVMKRSPAAVRAALK